MLAAAIGAGALVATFGAVSAAASPATATSTSTVRTGSPVQLTRVGSVNLGKLAQSIQAKQQSGTQQSGTSTQGSGVGHVIPLKLPGALSKAAANPAKASANAPRIAATTSIAGNVKGARGFNAQTARANERNLGFDVSPPDQGMAVGTGRYGTSTNLRTLIIQGVNLSLRAYNAKGQALTTAVPANVFFNIGACTGTGFPTNCPSDPRVYWDPQTQHWFITDFTFTVSPPAEQYIAVSNTRNGLGGYTIFSVPTGQGWVEPGDCPCFGDYDMVGADNSGFYITVNEFSLISGGFHGTAIFAMSKKALIQATVTKAPVLTFVYAVPYYADQFAAYHLAPSSVVQGSKAPNNEYFVESDSNAFSDSALQVWALLATWKLNLSTPVAPKLVVKSTATEGYSFPPLAIQKQGQIPLGNSVGSATVSPLQTDFNAVQQVSYASGELYAQLDTGVNAGGGALNSGVAWFALHPTPHHGYISVTDNNNGYVGINGHLLYPSIGVGATGHGYIAFAMSSGSMYPSAGYIKFNGVNGTSGPVHMAKAGTYPLDDFTCYPGFGYFACRYGDYSATQVYNGRIYMATEYVHFLTNVGAGAASNWGTRIWSAPMP